LESPETTGKSFDIFGLLHKSKIKMTNIITEDDDSFYRTTKIDLILIVLVLFLSTFSIIWISVNRIKQSSLPKVASIYQESIKLEEIYLEKDGITSILNGKMKIEVKSGKIRILDSDCPQKVCVKMGWIDNSGQTIVCMPNHVLIEIKSSGSPLIDAVSY
jgi:hypothetical protein